MTQTVLERHALSEAFADLVKKQGALTEAVLDGVNNRETADVVFLHAMQASLANQEFYKLLSLAHAETFGLDPDEQVPSVIGRGYCRPNSPNENIDDFADWAMKLAVERGRPPVNPYYDPWKEHALGARQVVSVGFRHAAE